MSVTPAQARGAAHDSVRQALSASVINLRPLRDERRPYDADREVRRLDLDVWEWTLVLIGLRRLGSQTASDLADLVEQRLQHPSAAVSS